ncbi:hypothetical protein VTK26DRAFT_3200 [Humicola hyalothermophila]
MQLSDSGVAAWWARIAHTYSSGQIEFWGTLAVQVLFFWVPAIGFTALDYVFPAFSARHKLQPAPKQPTWAEIKHCFWVVFRNQLQSVATALLILANSELRGKPSGFRITATLPPISEFARDVAFTFVVREISFYYIHRLFHSRYFYKRIHKLHHEFTAPVALAAQYAHPVEQLLANTLPIVGPPLVMGSHILTLWFLLAVMLLETALVHSGYDFVARIAKTHDEHHEKFNLNYSPYGVMDWLHGTHRLKSRKVE